MASAHQPTQQQYSMPPSGEFSGRLPSIRDLNFPHTYQLPPPERGGPPNGPTQSEHNASPQTHAPRHENPSWSRAPPSSQPSSVYHSPNAPPPADTKPSVHKSENAYSPQGPPYATSAGHGATNVSQGNARADGAPQHTSKRRADPAANVSAGRSSHPSYHHPPYPPQQPPPPQYQPPVSGGSAPPPPPHESAHPPPQFAHPSTAYPPYPPPQQHVGQRPPYSGPPPHPSQQPHVPPTNSFPPPPPPPPDQWQQQQQQGPPPQYDGYPRTTPLVPSAVDGRNVVPVNDANRTAVRQTTVSEVGQGPFTLRPEHPLMIKEQIVQHCHIIYNFAHRYASLQNTVPHVQPPHDELREMHFRATTIMKLLEDLRRMASPSEPTPRETPSFNGASDDPRPPKRPWEDARHEELMPNGGSSEYNEDGPQTTAEQDMEIIRSKRATSTSGTAPGQPKSKYRKRSRATPPGKCHSCNIRETPEWRRGPDGARTLCNACGLHYAKLMRKREKAAGPDGKAPPIDLQTLRASTASARGADANGDPNQPAPPPGHHPVPPMHSAHPHQGHPPPPPPHGPPYQLVPLPPNQGPPPPHQMMPPPPAPAPHESGNISSVPPPPWMTPNSTTGRPYADPAYMRSSHQTPHSRTPPQ